MTRLFSYLFLFIFSTYAGAQQQVFQGRVDLGKDLAAFETTPPISGTLYLLTGAAATIKIVSKDPFVAEVDFVQGEWKDEADLLAHRTLLRFEGAGWSKLVVTKKPRQDSEGIVYPYRKFQVAAVASPGGFRVLAVPLFF
jgi:hypothetical protein